MKILEIILKIFFLVGSLYLIWTESTYEFLLSYLSTCFVLGAVLIFNRKQSYGYQLSEREVLIRRAEGMLLIVFSILIFSIRGYL